MADPALPAAPDEASLHIAASPEQVYDLVADISRMGELSPECTGGAWQARAIGPTVGAVFKGTNRRGIARWSTTNTVVAAERGSVFSFETKQSGARWTYRFEADGDGTLVTERREMFKAKPLVAKVFAALVLGGEQGHDDELRAGMHATLERLKALAEAPTSAP